MLSSTLTVGHAQSDGRRYVVERHVDDVSVERIIEYGPVDTIDYAAVMAARAAAMDSALAEAEVDDCIANNVIRSQYQTGAQFAARLRARYAVASKETAARIAAWILDRITAGQLTDLQVRAAFGLTTTQYNAMKTRMTTLRTQWLAIQSAVGE